MAAGFPECRCVRVASWMELRKASDACPPDLVMFDPGPGGGQESPVAAFRRDHPSVPLVAYSRYAVCSAQTIVELAHEGVRCAITYGADDGAQEIMDRVAAVLVESESARILAFLLQGAPQELHGVIEHIWTCAHARLGTEDVARLLFCHPKTARERFARAGLPPPGRIISWCRLLRAAQLLQNGRRSVLSVARALGYNSAAALYRLLEPHTGLSPSDLRRSDAVDLLLARFSRTPFNGHADLE